MKKSLISAMTKEIEPVMDRLPDYFEYRDRGCDLSPSCLNCPMPKCRHDKQEGDRHAAKRLRDREILRLRTTGEKSAAALAAEFRLSRRTIERIIRRLSDEQREHCRDKARLRPGGCKQ